MSSLSVMLMTEAEYKALVTAHSILVTATLNAPGNPAFTPEYHAIVKEMADTIDEYDELNAEDEDDDDTESADGDGTA